MDKVIEKLTVYFEEPFWVGIFEYIEDDELSPKMQREAKKRSRKNAMHRHTKRP